MSVFAELKRRNVLRVGAAYIVTGWLIVQVVETLFPIYGLSDAAARAVVNILAIGLIPVLVLSWVFEWTPEGLKKDADVDHDRAFVADSAKRLDRIILVVLALALGYFAFDKFVVAPQQRAADVAEARQAGRSEALVESYGDASIAVLAFENMSPDPDQAFFAEGISEEILNLLADVPEVRVVSRSSAFTYKGKDVPVPQIAKELNVNHVLEGSVRKAGNQIRVTAQLIDGRSDTHLWSQTWDRSLDDVFAIQDEVAAEVVRQLEVQISGGMPVSRRTNPEAYAYTLEAKQILEQRRNFDQVNSLLERALDLDPDYVPALEALVLHDQLVSYYNEGSTEQFERRIEVTSNRILSLDPNNVVMLTDRAFFHQYLEEHKFEVAIDQLMRLIERDPNNTHLLRRATQVLRRTGYFEQAVKVGHHCIRVDPLKHSCVMELKEAYMWWGQAEKAREFTDKLKTRWQQPRLLHEFLLLIWEGKPAEARAWVGGQMEQEPEPLQLPWLALAEYAQGNVELFDMHIKAAIDHHDAEASVWFSHEIAGAYATAGYHDEAFRWLEVTRINDPDFMFAWVFGPFLLPLRDDPRWGPYLHQLGLGPERRAAYEFEVPLPSWVP